jgi:PilZ domain
LRRAVGPQAQLTQTPDVHDDDERRKAQAPGFPYRAPTPGRRASRRQRVLLSALIVDVDAETTIRCRVENVSDQGARIRLADPRFLPPSFWLVAVTAGLAYWATTVWREDDRLGVTVEDPFDLKDPASLMGHKLRPYWLNAR